MYRKLWALVLAICLSELFDVLPDGQGRRRARPSPNGDGHPTGNGRLRCLIIDDNIHFIAAARRILEYDGLRVVGAAKNGTTARPLIARLRPDVILVDFFLGKENGFEFIVEIGRTGVGDHAVMVLCSSQSEDDVLGVIGDHPVPFLSKIELCGSALRDIVRSRRA
jgi:two-component system, NarL family, nitrate/nitrite response regulator NarL